MYDTRRSNCEKAFKVDESGYAEVHKQLDMSVITSNPIERHC
jgi:hypothetical protein